MPDQALSDVKVLDLTWYITGPYCTKLLADYGANVVKVERPGEGDPARHLGPFLGDDPHPEKSGLFLHLNTNKRGITLNLKSKTGKNILKELVKDVDILVESFRPGVMERLGLGYEVLEKVNPKLVMTSISNFGQDGPYRDFKASEVIINAMGHTMSSCGLPNREPLKRGANALQYQSGQVAAAATMGALMASRLQGIGQQVDISIMETHAGSADFRTQNLLGYIYSGEECPRVDPRDAGLSILPYGVLPAKDGYVQWLLLASHWSRLCRMLGEPEAEMTRRFPDLFDMTRKGELDALTSNWSSTHTKREVMQKAQAYSCPATAINTPAELVEDPHFAERHFFVEAEHPVAGVLKYIGAPIKIEDAPWGIRRPAPLLGQHNAEVYCALGYTGEQLVKLREMDII